MYSEALCWCRFSIIQDMTAIGRRQLDFIRRESPVAFYLSTCEALARSVLIPCVFTSSPEGWEPVPELLEAFRTEFALRLFWGQQGAVADKKERYEKFDKILCVLSNKLEPVEVTPQQPGALT
ncbi:hypothetical protein ILYODFUR_034020 [Ilyodon furcidens]|uniref:Uncharacterized protein n=1 Tax=Ilyodon furcidens TaxID=33524 RepID=A0ABV0UAP3_9TELE